MKRTMKILAVLLCLTIGLVEGFAQDIINGYDQTTLLKQRIAAPNRIAQKLLNVEDFVSYNLLQTAPQLRNALDFFKQPEDVLFFNLRNAEVNRLMREKPENLTFSIPGAKGPIQVKLTKSNFFNSSSRLITSDGRQFRLEDFQGLFYQGLVEGNQKSLVTLSIVGDEFSMLLADEAGNYNIGRMPNDAGTLVFFNDRNVAQGFSFNCGYDDQSFKKEAPKVEHSGFQNQVEDKCVKVYIECDNSLYKLLGERVTGVYGEVSRLFHNVALIYAEEQIRTEISDVFVWTAIDPYVNDTTTKQALDRFKGTRTS